MAAGWFHQTQDLIAFGRIYPYVQREKDAASQRMPGRRHREVGHDYYRQYGKLWSNDNPFPPCVTEAIQRLKDSKGPEVAEEEMASYAHDHLDRVWDELARETRRYWEGCFVCLLYHPEVLESWAGVDVIRGKIRRSIDGQEIWEDSPETREEYRKLRREVSRHVKYRLKDMLDRYCG